MSELSLLVESLRKPEKYDPRPERVDFLQTHMSLIFIAGDFVYKVKKNVNLGYLDYTTLEKRKFFCDQELKLNQRFGKDVYLAVLPVTQRAGDIAIGGAGTIIDYTVKMRKLPLDRMMDVMLPKGQVTLEMIDAVARKVADFHGRAETSPAISGFGGLDVIRTNTKENWDQTRKYIGQSITAPQFDVISAFSDGFVQRNAALFGKRVAEGRVRDLHGDLHAQHICFAEPLCIYDCIEFNERFRYADVAAEVSFLAMDLDYHRHPDLSQRFVDSYVAASGDRELLKLLAFYKCYYAYVRGKVASFKLDDPLVPPGEKRDMLEAAKRYFKLAESYTSAPDVKGTRGRNLKGV